MVTRWNPAALGRHTPQSHAGLGSNSVELKKKIVQKHPQRKSILVKFGKIQLNNLLPAVAHSRDGLDPGRSAFVRFYGLLRGNTAK